MRVQLARNSPLDLTTAIAASPFVMNWLDNREHILNSLLSNLDGMVYCCLLNQRWTMFFVSDGCQKLTGYNTEELLNTGRISYEQLTHENDREMVRVAIEKAIKLQQRYEIEYRIITMDGDLKWVLERGSGILNPQGETEAIEGFIQDITLRKMNEQALEDAERRYRGIFENIAEVDFPQ